MAVRRITANLPATDPATLSAFYAQLPGLDVVMELGFISTLAGGDAAVQLSLGREGGAGTPLPLASIEVSDCDATLAIARAPGARVEYGRVTEAWGVRRFYLRDPEGNLINIVSHVSDQSGTRP